MVSTFLFRALNFLRTDPRLLAYGFLLSFGSGFGQTYFIALFSGNVRGEYGISHGGFGAVYAAATLSSALVLTWTGRWIDRIDLRRWTATVVVLLAGACLAMALAWNMVSLVVAIFLLRQMGQGSASVGLKQMEQSLVSCFNESMASAKSPAWSSGARSR